ncbi:hypothetical protein QJS66_01665 [Kocuria rhizophila]|nr:hypothetical protein QJS66_01665 [Kocuria rhizophila]
MQQVIRATKAGDWSVTDGGVVAGWWRWRRAMSWSRWSWTPRRLRAAPRHRAARPQLSWRW